MQDVLTIARVPSGLTHCCIMGVPSSSTSSWYLFCRALSVQFRVLNTSRVVMFSYSGGPVIRKYGSSGWDLEFTHKMVENRNLYKFQGTPALVIIEAFSFKYCELSETCVMTTLFVLKLLNNWYFAWKLSVHQTHLWIFRSLLCKLVQTSLLLQRIL